MGVNRSKTAALIADQIGGNTASLAAFPPHRPHFILARAASSGPAPQAPTNSTPLIVRADPQSPHSMRTLARKRTRSAPVWMCLVDIPHRYAPRNV